MRTMTRLVGLIAVVLLAAAIVAVPVSAATSTNLYTPLHGSTAYPTATGSSYYSSGMGMMGSRDVKVTVNHMTRLAGQRVAVFLNGTRIGWMLLTSTGYGYHHWTGSFLPYCMSGSGVVVRTSGGTVIVTGMYR